MLMEDQMAEETKIVVDIGEAAAMLKASPELTEEMNRLVGGPALVEAQKANEALVVLLRRVLDEWDDGQHLTSATIQAVFEAVGDDKD
jgi:hypothetical protein